MAAIIGTNRAFTVKAYAGDMKTLLAFNFSDAKSIAGFAGFTIQCKPHGQQPYYIQNNLQFEKPGSHAQDQAEPANSSINAPIHKFRWIHVPGSVHQGLDPLQGSYTYIVTPRYFDSNASMLPLDPQLSAQVTLDVKPFSKGSLALGFTRGYTQSQAFVHHFGLTALIQPKQKTLLFDTTQQSGTNARGQAFTFADEYNWLGFTARQRILTILNQVLGDRSLHLDMCAYDLNEPDVMKILLQLAGQGRIRMLLDNAALHHNANGATPEDEFEQAFGQAAQGKAAILRGHFGRYAHDKVLIVSDSSGPAQVLTGSTNFSVTGLYVNSNHILHFDDRKVAQAYSGMFEEVWSSKASKSKFASSDFGSKAVTFEAKGIPKTTITFAPHVEQFADSILQGVADRIAQEGQAAQGRGSVLFAVMEMDNGTSPVYTALKDLHENSSVFSFGISDNPGGIFLYPVGKKTGVLVSGKPGTSQLPPPFDQVRTIGGVGHQVHHKFVVCGFNGEDPVVYCGSSNLAQGGEANNGDNLLEIHDGDVATVFAIEALALVDHFNFLDRLAQSPKADAAQKPQASKQHAAAEAGWFLSTDDKWARPYFDANDFHNADRRLFG
ncbi:MAG: hypothetical protein J0H49_37550 [Acidobacteria bacterium]|nr:hypothetical protein [Acidobacteriota bacterium]